EGEDRISRQHAASPEQPPELPVRQTQLGTWQRVLAVHAPGEAVADERGVDPGVELLVQLGVPRHEAGDEAGRVAVEGIDGGVDGRRRPERDLRAPLPLPFAAQLADIDRLSPRLRHLFLGAGYRSGLS